MAQSKPNTPPPGEPDPAQIKKVLIPAVAIGVVIVLVAVLVAVFDTTPAAADKDGKGGAKGKGAYPPATGGSDVAKLTDGTEPGAEDPGLKPIGTEGLKYRDLKEGDGREVRAGETVTAYYTGWLTNGTVFDSARQRGEPIAFSLGEVVKGWGQGIPGMKVGGIRKLVIPPELGYGSRSQGKIPANSTLIFEVELVDVK